MAVLNSSVFSLVDAAKRMKPDGSVETDIAELLTQTNEILVDCLWKEGNLPTGHRLTMRTGLPTGTWRRFNEGVANTKSTTIQVDETCAMYEQRGQIDKDLAMLNGDDAAYRLTENVAHMEAMNIDMATALFYADSATNPEKFDGFATRYDSLSASYAASQNILSGGGSGSDNTSIWLVGWGEKGAYCIYPKGSVAGLKHTPIKDGSGDGCTEGEDSNGNKFRAYVDHYQWKTGLAIKDWRYVVRIANIDVSNLVAESSAANLVKLMSRALDRIPTRAGIKLAFYANRTVFSMLKIQALNLNGGGLTGSSNATAGVLSIEKALTQFGEEFSLKFLGVPIRLVDVLSNSESAIS